jgi:hypothetical protein
MKEIPTKAVTAGITLAVVAASPFVKKAATGLAEKEQWQWWNKATDKQADQAEKE